MLGERVARLERDRRARRACGAYHSGRCRTWISRRTPGRSPRRCEPAAGRVLHGDAGDGVIVARAARGRHRRLRRRAAAGARPSARRSRDLDVREEGVGRAPGGSPAGLARRPRAERRRRHAAERPAGGARPIGAPGRRARRRARGDRVRIRTRWGDGATRVVADLAPGRPWHTETWAHVLADRGLRPPPGDPRSGGRGAAPRRGAPSGVIAIHQFVPTVTRRDAIGHHVLELRDADPRPRRRRRRSSRSRSTASTTRSARTRSSPAATVRPRCCTTRPRRACWRSSCCSGPSRRSSTTTTSRRPGSSSGGIPATRSRSATPRREIAAIVRSADLVFTHSRFSARDVEDWGGPTSDRRAGTRRVVPRPRHGRATARAPAGAVRARRSATLAVRRPPGAEQGAGTADQGAGDLPPDLRRARPSCTSSASPTPPAYRDALARLAAAAGVGDAVHFHEGVSAEDLAALYRTADVFVSASAHEGFCVPVVEAMRFGVPVVARAAGAVPETAGGAAVLVPGDSASTLAVAVHRVLADPALADRLSGGRSRPRRDADAPGARRLPRRAPRAAGEDDVKVGFVVPRYGDEVFGGAERAAQQLAERLHARRGWAVEVLTTCALDYISWDNWYPDGIGRPPRACRCTGSRRARRTRPGLRRLLGADPRRAGAGDRGGAGWSGSTARVRTARRCSTRSARRTRT